MIRNKSNSHTPIVIDLNGPEGNAFYLISLASRLAEKIGLDENAITADMMSSDYDHLIEVFDQHFGEIVILEK